MEQGYDIIGGRGEEIPAGLKATNASRESLPSLASVKASVGHAWCHQAAAIANQYC
jgi:hypothetical protein